jgi:hypothetical protein
MRVDERVFNKSISPVDVRDYRIAVTAQDFPETFSLPTVTIKNQGSIGSCVAHACSSLVEYHNKRQENTNIVFSTEFIYGYRPLGYYVGEGMYVRDALKTLQKVGDCPLVLLKGNHSCPKAMEIVEAKFEELKGSAYPHRISTYVKVKKVNEIKQALMNYGYVVVSMPWYKNYKLKNGVYTYPTNPEKSGYHCVVIYGWDERGWLVQNSWGKYWGQKGCFVVPFDFKWSEAWAVTDTVMGEGDYVDPQENWFIKIFGPIINWFLNLFKKK